MKNLYLKKQEIFNGCEYFLFLNLNCKIFRLCYKCWPESIDCHGYIARY